MSIEILGYIAAIFGSTLKLPQIYKTINIKNVESISFLSLILEGICSCCWIIYAYIRILNTVLLANTLYFIEVIILIICYYKWKNIHINKMHNHQENSK
jgi:uncharacterized protein with PQ loop repeat